MRAVIFAPHSLRFAARGLGLTAVVVGGACGDSDPKGEVDAQVEVATEVDVQAETEVTIEVEVEAETGIACAPGTGVEVVADGPIRLEHCGATLTGSAPDGTLVELNVVEAPAPFPFEHDLLGPAFEVSGVGFSGQLAIVDDGEPPGYRMAAQFFDGDWQGFEACPGETGTSFGVSTGLFALFRDVNTYPDSPRDIGSGTVNSTFMGESITWTFDDGYAIHEAGADGLRFVTVIVRRTPRRRRPAAARRAPHRARRPQLPGPAGDAARHERSQRRLVMARARRWSDRDRLGRSPR
jgi:hypothetical protein